MDDFYRSVFYSVLNLKGKDSPLIFRALIESPEEHDLHMEIFSELGASQCECKITPITMEGKLYDFFYHNTLKEAQEFCETMGYEILKAAPNEAIWKRKLFAVK